MSFYKLGEYEKAEENFQRARELNPYDPLPYRMIGLCNYRKNQLDEAVKYLCISLTLEDADNVITLSIIGNIYYKQKKYNNSVIVYRRLASFTNSAFVFYRLMHSLERVGKLEEAVRVGEDFLKSCSWEDFDEKV
ncbi:MAG: tetratricopeptide repeat protein, partial [Brevinematia bacterium]